MDAMQLKRQMVEMQATIRAIDRVLHNRARSEVIMAPTMLTLRPVPS